MRDLVLARRPYAEFAAGRYRAMGIDPSLGLRCIVCRSEMRFLTEYATPARSPLGREMVVVTCSSHYCRSRAQAHAFDHVDQTTFGNPYGNCFSACVAALLELPIEKVPWFMGAESWWQSFLDWLEPRGFTAEYWPRTDAGGYTLIPMGFSIAGGHHTRGRGLHACVAYDGRVVHDPNSRARTELTDIVDYITIKPLER